MSKPVWGSRIVVAQERSLADRIEAEIRALADERRKQIADDMRNGTPERPPGTTS